MDVYEQIFLITLYLFSMIDRIDNLDNVTFKHSLVDNIVRYRYIM